MYRSLKTNPRHIFTRDVLKPLPISVALDKEVATPQQSDETLKGTMRFNNKPEQPEISVTVGRRSLRRPRKSKMTTHYSQVSRRKRRQSKRNTSRTRSDAQSFRMQQPTALSNYEYSNRSQAEASETAEEYIITAAIAHSE